MENNIKLNWLALYKYQIAKRRLIIHGLLTSGTNNDAIDTKSYFQYRKPTDYNSFLNKSPRIGNNILVHV